MKDANTEANIHRDKSLSNLNGHGDGDVSGRPVRCPNDGTMAGHASGQPVHWLLRRTVTGARLLSPAALEQVGTSGLDDMHPQQVDGTQPYYKNFTPVD